MGCNLPDGYAVIRTDADHLSCVTKRLNSIDSISVETACDFESIIKILLFLLLLVRIFVVVVTDLLRGDIEKREDSIAGADHQVSM